MQLSNEDDKSGATEEILGNDHVHSNKGTALGQGAGMALTAPAACSPFPDDSAERARAGSGGRGGRQEEKEGDREREGGGGRRKRRGRQEEEGEREREEAWERPSSEQDKTGLTLAEIKAPVGPGAVSDLVSALHSPQLSMDEGRCLQSPLWGPRFSLTPQNVQDPFLGLAWRPLPALSERRFFRKRLGCLSGGFCSLWLHCLPITSG